jgi:glycosyltransferase involved in cell wall biosynthesis
MENFPKVSVVMPVYNKAPYVKEAIDSVLNQTFTDFEFIIIDDGSIDGSQEIILSYNDPKIRFFQNENNIGPGGCSNYAILIAKGEYIIRQDADDIAPSYRLEEQVKFMDANPKIGVSSGHLQCFGSDDNIWKLPLTDDQIKASFLFTVPICQGASIIRKEVLLKNNIKYGDISNYIGEDRVLWFNLREVTDFGNLDKILLYYRRGKQNIKNDKRFKRDKIRLEIYRLFFFKLNIEVSDEELVLHWFCEQEYNTDINKNSIKSFRQWLNKLKQINNIRHLFPEPFFSNYIENSWIQMFYRIADINLNLLIIYWKISGKIRIAELVYALKVRMKKVIKLK